ncbi:MAG: TonB-dependent receptor [Flavobacteriales bacterium]|nr:TonB-dependent receptor [Flavobacteriales bacterium]
MISAAFAQAQGSVRGFVKDAASGQPVLFISVILEGTQYGTQTDENGFYSLTKVPAGNYTLVIKQLGFKEIREQIVVTNDKLLTKNYMLEVDDLILGEITITEEGDNQRNNVNISVESMRTKDIKRIPSFGGSPDLVQALTTLPGIISTGDQGGQIYVRGGSPVQNKVLLDGMIVYNAFHSIGLFSVFDTDVISNADVYTGGFSAQYGGRISSDGHLYT